MKRPRERRSEIIEIDVDNSIEGFGQLPLDLITNILLKMPATSLLGCRSVCIAWRDIIDSPLFCKDHLAVHHLHSPDPDESQLLLEINDPDRPKTQFFPLKLYDHHGSDGHDNSLTEESPVPILDIAMPTCNSFPFDFRCIESMAYGLLLCSEAHSNLGAAFLLNPLRGEVLMLPRATVARPYGLNSFTLGFDPSTATYKVVHIYERCRAGEPSVASEVYVLGTGLWRQISSVPPICYKATFITGISTRGFIHWKGMGPDLDTMGLIVSFDTKTETFTSRPLPVPLDFYHFHIFNFKGRVALFFVSSPSKISIWTLRDYEKNEWFNEYTMDLQRRFRGEQVVDSSLDLRPDSILFSRIIGAWRDGLLIVFEFDHLLYYNMKTASVVEYFPRISDENATWCYTRPQRWYKCFTGNLVSLKTYGNLLPKLEAGLGNRFNLGAALSR